MQSHFSGDIDRAIKYESDWYQERDAEQDLDYFELRFRDFSSDVIMRLSGLVLDLFIYTELKTNEEAWEAFFSILDEAPDDSVEKRLRHTDLAMDKIKGFVLKKYKGLMKDSEDNLFMNCSHAIMKISCDGRHWEVLDRLLDPTPIDLSPRTFDHVWIEPEEFFRYEKYVSICNIRYQWMIIQRLPRAQQFIRDLKETPNWVPIEECSSR